MDTDGISFKKEVFRLLTFYSLLLKFLDVFFSGYRIHTSTQVNMMYFTLCNIIQDSLSRDGFTSLRSYPWRPFDNLMSLDPDYPEVDWEYGGRKKYTDFLSQIQELHLVNGEVLFELNSIDLKQINKIQNFIGEYSEQKNTSDAQFLKNIDNMTGKTVSESEAQVFPSDVIKVFLSYSTKDKKQAGSFKHTLEKYGLDVFLAHEDIRPSEQWQNEIVTRLRECHIFIPLFSSNFPGSKWTDQETGIAFGLKKKVIPVSLDEVNPYGFVGRYQSLKCKGNISTSCTQILEIIVNDPIGSVLVEKMIKIFLESGSFNEANELAGFLDRISGFVQRQINEIVYGFLINNQVYLATSGRTFVLKIVDQNKDKINPILFDLFIKFKANRYRELGEPFWNNARTIHEAYIEHILSERSNLTREAVDLLIEKEKVLNSVSTFEAIMKVYDNLGILF